MSRKEQMLQEIKLRRLIRKAIKIKQRREERLKLTEEEKLRTVIRALLEEGVDADTNPAPYESTALNALADAFNQILPVLQTGLRKLKRPEERQSYRAHILQKFKSIFQNFEGLDTDAEGAIGEGPVNEQEQDDQLKIKIDDPDRVMPSDGREDARFTEEPAPKLEPDDDDIEKLAIDTEDPTGARRAFTTINNSNIEKLLADTRKLLPREEDRQEFKDYALYNVDLWLLTYEKEIADENGEAPAFDKAIVPKPSGAKVSGRAQEFEDVIEEIPEMEVPDIPELGEGGDVEVADIGLIPELGDDGGFQQELEEMLLSGEINVGE